MFWFAFASLLPAVLLGMGAIYGGIWPALGIASITVLALFADWLTKATVRSSSSGIAVCYLQAIAHVVLWVCVIRAVGHANSVLPPLNTVLLIVGTGLYFGQVSNSSAHELIHARARSAHRLGVMIYCSLLHGHHVSAHLRVHHIHAGTEHDPNSAPLGLGFWSFFLRGLRNEFQSAHRAETKRLAHAGRSRWHHPYLIYFAGAGTTIALSAALGGINGVGVALGLSLFAQLQLFLSDYVQHYGLRRHILPDGRYEPIGPRHAWNAPDWYSGAMMLNAPRHSDHHMRPMRAFPSLDLDADAMPILPYSLPVMAVIAMVPPLWRALMDARVADWQTHAPVFAQNEPNNVTTQQVTGQSEKVLPDFSHVHSQPSSDRPDAQPERSTRPDERVGI